jgi:ketopantoate hydroxymethyltransferase
MQRAFAQYLSEVQTRQFPGVEHSVEMSDEEWESFLKVAE